MPGCGIIIPAEARAQQMMLEILCYLTGKIDELQATVQAMHDDQLALKAEAEEILEKHRESAEEYFATFPDPCEDEGETAFDPCPFASLPAGTRRRELDYGAYVFILPDGMLLRVNGTVITAVLADGTIEDLAPDDEYQVHTSDGRTFDLNQACPDVPEPEEPPDPSTPTIPPDPVDCEEPE